MEMSISQKSIGFKLFGNIASSSDTNELIADENQTYEIFFFPGNVPLGTLTHLVKRDEKKITVDLPQELRQNNFEKICSFLLEKETSLAVKESGHEKLGNRKLVLELSYDSKKPVVNVILVIEGKWQSADYKIELNPYEISSSIGEIQNSKEYRKATVISEELKKVKKCDIIKVLPKLKPNNFHISILHDQIIIDLSAPFKQFIDSLGKPTKYQIAKKVSSQNAVPEEISDLSPEESSSHSNHEDKQFSKRGIWPIFRKLMSKD